MNVLDKEKTYFEAHYEEYLTKAEMNKAQFANAMGVAAQNVNKLIKTKNALTLSRVAEILKVPLNELLFGKGTQSENKQIEGCVFIEGEPNIVRSLTDIEGLLERIRTQSK